MTTRILALLLLITIVAVGCSSEGPTQATNGSVDDAQYNAIVSADDLSAVDDDAIKSQADADAAGFGWWYRHRGEPTTFTVRIENVSTATTLHLSNGQTAPVPLSPGAWAVTRLFNPFFRVGRYEMGIGLEELAEDGDPSILAANIENKRGIRSSGVFNTPVGAGGPAPAFPGDVYEFTVTAKPGDFLSFTTMFVQSNDLFYAPGTIGIPLFKYGWRPINGNVTRYLSLWDAGTEVNQEPGLGPDQAPRQSGPNTGESERKRVHRVHDQYDYPHDSEVIKVTITPMASGNM